MNTEALEWLRTQMERNQIYVPVNPDCLMSYIEDVLLPMYEKVPYKTQNAEGWGKGTLARLSADMVRPIAQPSVSQLQGNTVELHNNTITQSTVLPNDLRSSLPSIEDIEAEFDDDKEN